MGIRVAHVVPGGADERIHRIELTGGISPAFRALAVDKAFARGKRGTGSGSELHIRRQEHGQVLLRDEHFSAVRAVDDGDRSTPVALPADQPVTQTVIDAALAQALFLEIIDDGLHGLVHFHAREFPGIDEDTFLFGVGFGHLLQFQHLVFGLQGNDLLQTILSGEHPVTLVARRHAHDGARTIIHQDIVGDPDLDAPPRQRMDGIHARIHAELFRFTGRPFDIGRILDLLTEGFKFCLFRIVRQQLRYERMFRRNNDIGDAVDRIRTGRINRQLGSEGRDIEAEFQTFAASDPVALHGLDAFRPALQQIEILQELIGIIRDFQEPLGQFLLFHRGVAAPALAVDDLFVGQYGVTLAAPVYGSLFLDSQAPFVHEFKEPLGPLVIIGHAGLDFTVPVIGQAHALLLLFHIGDIFQGPLGRRDVVLDRRIFSRHAERVEPHRMQHIVAVHRTEAGHDIADGVVPHVPHVQVAGWIWEHFQYIVLRSRIRIVYFVDFMVFPILLPPHFYFMRFILFFDHSIPSRKKTRLNSLQSRARFSNIICNGIFDAVLVNYIVDYP